MIDSHTHLFDEKFDDDIDDTINRAKAAGIDRFILPATEPHEYKKLFSTALRHPHILFPTMGLHPLAMNANPNWRDDLDIVSEHLKNPPVKFYAIGETGLDLHWDTNFLKEQIEAFVAQIELSIRYDLPLVLHMRDAFDFAFDILEPYKGRVRGVFHSFSGSSSDVAKIERLGNFIYGINGTVTYKKSILADTLRHIDIEKMVLETDAPYLPPQGHRGERNEPSYIAIIADKVAQIKGISVDDVDEITTKNAINFFKL